MKKVIEETTNLELVSDLLPTIDFADTFSTTNHTDDMETVTKLVLDNRAKWIDTLLVLRNKIVRFFGLKTTIPEDYSTDFKVGGYVSFFQIYSITENKIILGANDKHLNFRVVIRNEFSNNYNIKVVTLVEYNNSFGKFYMAIVKPFHKIVLKSMVKKAYKA